MNEVYRFRLIVALGNPGAEYEHTRHNAGFLLLHQFLNTFNIHPSHNNKFDSLIAYSSNTVFCFPESFMNNSGSAVSKIASFYKINPSDICVIHDDMDFSTGICKLQLGRNSAGHNGVKDIIDKLNTNGFWRLRVGIGRPLDNTPMDVYVLKKLTKEQITTLRAIDLREYLLVED